MSLPIDPQPALRPLHWSPIVFTLQEILGEDANQVYLVGGVVRDAFWGRPAHDIDLAVPHTAFQTARQIADKLGGAFYKLDPMRETGRAIITVDKQRVTVDVATFRGSDLLEDLTGRDFTINAVAAPLHSDLSLVIDPLGGLQDAQQHILRRCSPTSLADDPIRALRAVRLSIRFGLRIEPDTLADIRREGPRMLATSAERIRDEFIALLGGRQPATALRILDALNLAVPILPFIETMRMTAQSSPHRHDVWTHTLAVVEQLDRILQTISPQRTDNTAAAVGPGMFVYYLDQHRAQLQEHLGREWPGDRSSRALLMLAALLHDAGKPATGQQEGERIRFLGHETAGLPLIEELCQTLRLSRQETEYILRVVRNHMRPHHLARESALSRRAIYRFWRDCGPAGVDICLLALADYLAIAGPELDAEQWSSYLQTAERLLDGYFGQSDTNVVSLPALVTGQDLVQRLGLQPGPQIGALLESIREAQAGGEVTTPEDALALAARLLQK